MKLVEETCLLLELIGINNVKDAEKFFKMGADKISFIALP